MHSGRGQDREGETERIRVGVNRALSQTREVRGHLTLCIKVKLKLV